jgi:hypothetical protein
MSYSRMALLLAASLAISSTAANAVEPPLRQRWRPSQLPSAPVPPPAPFVLPRFLPAGADAISTGSGQVAYVDPATGELLSGAPAGAKALPDFVSLPAPVGPMRAGRTPEGFLFIETNGHHETLVAVLDAEGKPQLRCGDPLHDHPAPAGAAVEPRR